MLTNLQFILIALLIILFCGLGFSSREGLASKCEPCYELDNISGACLSKCDKGQICNNNVCITPA
jgi:hypothetical protein